MINNNNNIKINFYIVFFINFKIHNFYYLKFICK